jgi:hypothetical protein
MNIYDYKGYYTDYLKERSVSLKDPLHLEPFNVEMHWQALIEWAESNLDLATVKDYIPRPFTREDALRQAVMVQNLGYSKHNTTELNWGIEPEHNEILKKFLGEKALSRLDLEEDSMLVRLLRYDPGHCIPLHTDSYDGFKKLYGSKALIKRYFIAVSPWDWGHFLQIHDNMIHHWEPGYCVEVPNEAFHLSGNCGISPKYTLTVTGFVND